MRLLKGLKSGTGATFSIANKFSNIQKTNLLMNVSICVQYTKDTCFSYKNLIGTTSRSTVESFLFKDERYPKLDAFVYENGGYRWRVPKTTCS